MAPITVELDVTGPGIGGPHRQVAWLFPAERARLRGVLLCLAGGTYDRHYWHLEVPGLTGYSFAQHAAARRWAVVALDHLGVGDSDDPAGIVLDLPSMCEGDVSAARQVRAGLDSGSLLDGVRPSAHLPLIGVGHSMGACLTTMVQAGAKPYDGVALLGYGVQITNVRDEGTDDLDLDARVEESEAMFRAATRAAPDASSVVVPRSDLLRPLFYAADVPTEVVEADEAVASRVPVRAASQVTTAGYVADAAAAVDVPVFLAFGGAIDVSPDPHQEPAAYKASADITLLVLPGSAHCHNQASNRAVLWDRLCDWADGVAARTPTGEPL